MSNILSFNKHESSLLVIETELVDIEQLVASFRLLWEHHDPNQRKQVESITITLAYIVEEKCRTALAACNGALVRRVAAGRRPA